METDSTSHPKVAIVTAIICIAYLVFVFVYDDLRSQPFIQGITAILVGLAIAVVLFSAVPGSSVRKGLYVGGAAGFYLLLLPQIRPFVFPFYSFTGSVIFEKKDQSEKEITPVENADVAVKDTTGLTAKTSSTGQFTISNIPSQTVVRELIISRGGHFYVVETKKYPDKMFTIPHEPIVTKSNVLSIASENWSALPNSQCASVEKNKYTKTAQFLLTANVHNDKGYSDLVVRVWSLDHGTDIIQARKLEPPNGSKVQDEDGYSKAQKWQLPVEGEMTKLSFNICVGANRKDLSSTKSSLGAAYWFQRID